MEGNTFEVKVQSDHLEGLTSKGKKPIFALSELIWNALDADADNVNVNFNRNSLGEVSSIEICDDGHGIPYSHAEELFSNLGGSWKRARKQSHHKLRHLHGSKGQGRFRAFRFGRTVDWNICYVDSGSPKSYRISMTSDNLRRFTIGHESVRPSKETSGVRVAINELDQNWELLHSENSIRILNQLFAPYLREYPTLGIKINEVELDYLENTIGVENYELPDIVHEGKQYPVSLEIIEWKSKVDSYLYLCDGNGFPLDSTAPVDMPR